MHHNGDAESESSPKEETGEKVEHPSLSLRRSTRRMRPPPGCYFWDQEISWGVCWRILEDPRGPEWHKVTLQTVNEANHTSVGVLMTLACATESDRGWQRTQDANFPAWQNK